MKGLQKVWKTKMKKKNWHKNAFICYKGIQKVHGNVWRGGESNRLQNVLVTNAPNNYPYTQKQ